jgi:hypothetical protein
LDLRMFWECKQILCYFIYSFIHLICFVIGLTIHTKFVVLFANNVQP